MRIPVPTRQELIDGAAFAAALAAFADSDRAQSSAGRLAVSALVRRTIGDGQARIRARFEAGLDGLATATAHSDLIDAVLGTLYTFTADTLFHAAAPTAGERLALIAVGGYGRSQLAPFSDVDLLFLHPYKPTPWTEQVVEYLYYVLWDSGLKVGHAVRSLDESIRYAKQDITIRTSVLEARFVAGDRALFQKMRRRFDREVVAGSGPDFIDAKLAERNERHRRMGDSRYVVEPNVKEGKGGLRDLHTLYWIAKYLYRVDDMRLLVEKSGLTAREFHRFTRDAKFLWAVRCELHYRAGRGEDRLTLDLQPEIGRRLGYKDHAGATGVERFMKHYFLVAKSVGDLTRIFCAALEEQHRRRPLLRLPRLAIGVREIDGFVIHGGRLNAANDDVFAAEPRRLIRLFHLADERGLDIHPALLRLITRNLHLLKRLRSDKEANRLFLEILTSRGDPETALRRMNEAGVLGRFVPDFGRVVAQMQYDMYHVYTVDEHSIRAIGILAAIEKGKLAEEHPVANEIVAKVKYRRALYLALFLHDIAKGRGGDHSEIGAEIADRLARRLGMTPEEVETTVWLVKYHLVMSHYAFKRDAQDPQTVTDFVKLVQSPERLRLLAILTVADIRAVGPGRWNGWKGQLLRELFAYAEEALSGGAAKGRTERAATVRAGVRARLTDWSEREFDLHAARFDDAYWLAVDLPTAERHALLMREADAGNRAVALAHRADLFRSVSELTLYAADQPGLFARLAGAMALAGVSVVDAKITTTVDGMAIDTFWLQGPDGGVVPEGDRLARLLRTVEQSVDGRLALERLLARRSTAPRRLGLFAVVPDVLVDNEASQRHTVIEIVTRDRPQLLYDLTLAVSELGLSIASAHVHTFGERAVDVFYVKDKFGLKVTHAGLIERVRKTLLAVIDPAVATARPVAVARGEEKLRARLGVGR